MLKSNKIVKCLAYIFGVISLSLGIGYAVLAWTEPLLSPPDCTSGTPGCDEPLNVSDSMQIKTGPLILNQASLAANGLTVNKNALFLQGRVGIGTLAPQSTLEVAGNVKISGTLEGLGVAPGYRGFFVPSGDFLVGGGVDSIFAFRHLNNNDAGKKNLMIFGNQDIGDLVNGPTSMTIDTKNNNVGIGEFLSGEIPDATLHIKSDSFILEQPQSPASSSPCKVGMIAWDSNNIYVCVAADTWKKSALVAY